MYPLIITSIIGVILFFILLGPLYEYRKNMGPMSVNKEGRLVFEDTLTIEVKGIVWSIILKEKPIIIRWEHNETHISEHLTKKINQT